MVMYRSRRLDEEKQKRRLVWAIIGTIGILAFFAIFGLKILIGFSVLVDRLRGTPSTTQTQQSLILPPILDPVPQATKSATIKIRGSGASGTTAIIYVNDKETSQIEIDDTGIFEDTITSLVEGSNTISAKLTDTSENTSDLSNILTIVSKKSPPKLELSSPEDNATIYGEDNKIMVQGVTESDTKVTINGRIVVIHNDNTFSYQYPLNEGENKLTIVAVDPADNTTMIERTVTYQK